MTVDEIAKALGLNPPLVQRVAVKWLHGDRSDVAVGDRQAGKTTETILQALSHLSVQGKPLLVVGPNKHLSDVMETLAQQWASRLGLDASKIRGASPTSHFYMGRDWDQLHVDPDAYRFMPDDVAASVKWLCLSTE